jgi:hypothetical protein
MVLSIEWEYETHCLRSGRAQEPLARGSQNSAPQEEEGPFLWFPAFLSAQRASGICPAALSRKDNGWNLRMVK